MIELAPYGSGRAGGGVRLLKDLDRPLAGRDVLLVEDVVDTGLTLGFLTRCFAERGPTSLAAVTLLDRPYRRLVDDVPLHHVGFTVPDELFAGYGLGLDERWRALPDLHIVIADELPVAIDARLRRGAARRRRASPASRSSARIPSSAANSSAVSGREKWNPWA